MLWSLLDFYKKKKLGKLIIMQLFKNFSIYYSAPVSGFPQGGGRDRIPTGFDVKVSPPSWEFDYFALPLGREVCHHLFDGDNIKPTIKHKKVRR